jgi:hypothetical protein
MQGVAWLVQATGKRGRKVWLGPSMSWRGMGELVDDPRAGATSQGDQGNVRVQAGVMAAAVVQS